MCPVERIESLPPGPYAYLLGLYLGDGCISPGPRCYAMRIALDAAYPGIIEECVNALEMVLPGKRAWHGKRPRCNCVDVVMYWKHWPVLFPQHGPGRKHDRTITLTPWQREISEKAPKPLIRGLIHSDGCRVVANDRGVESVRYHFTNRSEGIRQIYRDALDTLGIPWTRPSDQDVAVYRKAAVAQLDEFVGPKRWSASDRRAQPVKKLDLPRDDRERRS